MSGLLFRVNNKKVFTLDPGTGKLLVTVEDLNEISDMTFEVYPIAPDAIPAWFRVRINYSDFTAAATTEDIELFELPTACVVHAVMMVPQQSFGGGSISAYTLSVGITGNLTKYAAAYDVLAATPGDTEFQLSTTQGVENIGDSTSLRVAATSTSDDLDQATTGSIDIYLKLSRLQLPAV